MRSCLCGEPADARELFTLRARHETRFTEPLCAAGLSADAARIAVDAMIASFVGLALRARAGEIGRDEAIAIHARATVGLIRGLASR